MFFVSLFYFLNRTKEDFVLLYFRFFQFWIFLLTVCWEKFIFSFGHHLCLVWKLINISNWNNAGLLCCSQTLGQTNKKYWNTSTYSKRKIKLFWADQNKKFIHFCWYLVNSFFVLLKIYNINKNNDENYFKQCKLKAICLEKTNKKAKTKILAIKLYQKFGRNNRMNFEKVFKYISSAKCKCDKHQNWKRTELLSRLNGNRKSEIHYPEAKSNEKFFPCML